MSHTLKTSEAWEMHIITLWGITCYYIFTKAWFFRGGKIYFADKFFRVLSWEVELISMQPHLLPLGDQGELSKAQERDSPGRELWWGQSQEGNDFHEILTPTSEEKIIPAWVPHIFRALTDCVFIESFPENTKSEEYERYRAMKT